MISKPKFTLLLAAIAIMATGIFAVSAQDTTPPVQPPFGGMGHGMMFQERLLWDDDTAPMFTAVAEALGIDAQTLVSELQSGKTLAQLAEEKGVDLAAVTAAAQTTMLLHLDELVAAGVLTQAQADARLNLMQENWAERPLLNGTGCGMMTGVGRGGNGMWGNGDGAPRGRMGRGG